MLKDISKLSHTAHQAETTALEPTAFCWRLYWSSRFESLWSLLRKFAHLNAINHYEVLKLFKCNDVSQEIRRRKWCLRNDLRHFGALDPSKLSIIFGLSPGDLAGATVLPFVREHEAAYLTSEFLRFCPTCISQGFHSSIHQLLFLPNCPIHGDRLEIRCAECLTLTVSYKLPYVSNGKLSNCAHMVHGLSQHLAYGKTKELQEEAAKRDKALLPVAMLLMKRVEISIAEPLLTQQMPPGTRRKQIPRHFRRLLGFWIKVLGARSHKAWANVSKPKGLHIQVSHHEPSYAGRAFNRLNSNSMLPWQEEKEAEARDLELYRIYKAIHRHLIRNYLPRHRRCIVRVGRNRRPSRMILKWQGRTCPAANALLMWRMFLEIAIEPCRLFQPVLRDRGEIYRSRVHWTPPRVNLPDWVLRRIFALECVGLFHECLLVAEALYRCNAHSFHQSYVKGRRIPLWLVEKSETGEWTIHWWVSRPLSSVFNQSSSHLNSLDEHEAHLRALSLSLLSLH